MEVIFFNLSLRSGNPMEIMNAKTGLAATGNLRGPIPLCAFNVYASLHSLNLFKLLYFCARGIHASIK